jgi:hypothetical protein
MQDFALDVWHVLDSIKIRQCRCDILGCVVGRHQHIGGTSVQLWYSR